MKKKQHITLHKNLQNGKTNPLQTKTLQSNSHHNIMNKNAVENSKKILSHHKINQQKGSSHSKSAHKQVRPLSSSINKNTKHKIKQKAQSIKGSKKSIKRQHSIDQNSNTSIKHKNIYTDNYKDNNLKNKSKNKSKKRLKYTERSSSQSSRNKNQNNLQNSLQESVTQSIKSQSQRLQVDQLVQQLQQQQFSNLHKLKLHILNFIFKNRIIKDQQYDRLYQLSVYKFPQKEQILKSILFQIVSSLDN